MKTEYQNAIIDKIRAKRLELGYSQLDIAALLDISTGQMGNIETPTRPHKYTIAQLSMICDEFKLPIEDLFLDNKKDFSQDEIIRRLINSIIEYEK